MKALQVDGGSEFPAEFGLACQQKQLPLFVLPPKSPKLNATSSAPTALITKSFTQMHADSDHPPALNRRLPPLWEHAYNCVRPTNRLLTSRHWHSSPAGSATSERQSVTNLLAEYTTLTSVPRRPTLRSF